MVGWRQVKTGSSSQEPSALCRMYSTCQTKSLFLNSSSGTSFNQQISSLLYFVLLFTQWLRSFIIKVWPVIRVSVARGRGSPLSHIACHWSSSKQKKTKRKNHCLLRYRYFKTYFLVAWDICNYGILNQSFLWGKNKRKSITYQQPSFLFLSPHVRGWQRFPNLNS